MGNYNGFVSQTRFFSQEGCRITYTICEKLQIFVMGCGKLWVQKVIEIERVPGVNLRPEFEFVKSSLENLLSGENEKSAINFIDDCWHHKLRKRS